MPIRKLCLIVALVCSAESVLFAEPMVGIVKEVREKSRQVIIIEQTTKKIYALPVSTKTKPNGLSIFQDLSKDRAVSADVTMSKDRKTVKKTNQLLVILPMSF